MGGIGIWQIAIVALLVLVLFGRGRISEMMGDFGKGIKSFKTGLNEEDEPKAAKPSARIEAPADNAAPTGAPTADSQSADRSDKAS